MNSPNDFAAIIKSTRILLEVSQEELARALGVSFATVNRWENGKTSPSKLAKGSFLAYCSKMVSEGRLKDVPF